MMDLFEVNVASLEELTDELAAAGWDSTVKDVGQAKVDVVRLLIEAKGPFNLCDSSTNDFIREATTEETIESVLSSPEGHILVGGRTCYVAE